MTVVKLRALEIRPGDVFVGCDTSAWRERYEVLSHHPNARNLDENEAQFAIKRLYDDGSSGPISDYNVYNTQLMWVERKYEVRPEWGEYAP